ncbi:hypothetical protein [Vreelandella neptunia]|uniref:Uncharacterized protein n=1 Tax=Vreelandella neptunia TaxID=115551 RepID=A0ABS9S332_9GAMM|nr:hypothetical protein [Halomonas neptunia]MCH4810527.1 hypothetical protein [Halomonas neptunia]
MSQEQKKAHFQYPKNLIIKMVSIEDAIKLQYSNGIECTPENLANTEIKDFTYHLADILTKHLENIKAPIDICIEKKFFIDTSGDNPNKYIGMLFLEDNKEHEALTSKLAAIAYEITHAVINQKDILSTSYTKYTPPEDKEFIQKQSENFINKKNGQSIKHAFTVLPEIDQKKQSNISLLVNGQFCAPTIKTPETMLIEGHALPAGYNEHDNTVSLYSIETNNKISSTPFTLISNHTEHLMTLARAKADGKTLYYTGKSSEKSKGAKKQKEYSLSTLIILSDDDSYENFHLQAT